MDIVMDHSISCMLHLVGVSTSQSHWVVCVSHSPIGVSHSPQHPMGIVTTSTCPPMLTGSVIGGEAHANNMRSPWKYQLPGCSSVCFALCQNPKSLSLHRTEAVWRRTFPSLEACETSDAAPPAADASMETFMSFPWEFRRGDETRNCRG